MFESGANPTVEGHIVRGIHEQERLAGIGKTPMFQVQHGSNGPLWLVEITKSFRGFRLHLPLRIVVTKPLFDPVLVAAPVGYGTQIFKIQMAEMRRLQREVAQQVAVA